MTLTKPAIEYTSEERAAIYAGLILENMRSIAARNGGKLTGGQKAAAKANATKTFLKMGF